MRQFTAADVHRIARELARGRQVFRNGAGCKTLCPLCSGENRRRVSRTLSVTARGGNILFFCHRCEAEGLDIIREARRPRSLAESLPGIFRCIGARRGSSRRNASGRVEWHIQVY
jgi:hypothetical protein